MIIITSGKLVEKPYQSAVQGLILEGLPLSNNVGQVQTLSVGYLSMIRTYSWIDSMLVTRLIN